MEYKAQNVAIQLRGEAESHTSVAVWRDFIAQVNMKNTAITSMGLSRISINTLISDNYMLQYREARNYH